MKKEARNEYFKAKSKEDDASNRKGKGQGPKNPNKESEKQAKIQNILKPKEKTVYFQIG